MEPLEQPFIALQDVLELQPSLALKSACEQLIMVLHICYRDPETQLQSLFHQLCHQMIMVHFGHSEIYKMA